MIRSILRLSSASLAVAFALQVAPPIAAVAAETPSVSHASSGSPKQSEPREAVCLVCAVKEGATEPEAVKVTRTYEGREYDFCSAACAKAFDADPAAFAPPELPRPAPGFTVRDLDGRAIESSSLRGKVTLIDFWATWCKPCIANSPELSRLHRDWSARGFQVLGISIDEGGARKVRTFLAKHAVDYPVAVDSEKSPAWERFRVKAVPAAYLLDADGNIVRQWLGRVDPAEVERAIGELIEG